MDAAWKTQVAKSGAVLVMPQTHTSESIQVSQYPKDDPSVKQGQERVLRSQASIYSTILAKTTILPPDTKLKFAGESDGYRVETEADLEKNPPPADVKEILKQIMAEKSTDPENLFKWIAGMAIQDPAWAISLVEAMANYAVNGGSYKLEDLPKTPKEFDSLKSSTQAAGPKIWQLLMEKNYRAKFFWPVVMDILTPPVEEKINDLFRNSHGVVATIDVEELVKAANNLSRPTYYYYVLLSSKTLTLSEKGFTTPDGEKVSSDAAKAAILVHRGGLDVHHILNPSSQSVLSESYPRRSSPDLESSVAADYGRLQESYSKLRNQGGPQTAEQAAELQTTMDQLKILGANLTALVEAKMEIREMQMADALNYAIEEPGTAVFCSFGGGHEGLPVLLRSATANPSQFFIAGEFKDPQKSMFSSGAAMRQFINSAAESTYLMAIPMNNPYVLKALAASGDQIQQIKRQMVEDLGINAIDVNEIFTKATGDLNDQIVQWFKDRDLPMDPSLEIDGGAGSGSDGGDAADDGSDGRDDGDGEAGPEGAP